MRPCGKGQREIHTSCRTATRRSTADSVRLDVPGRQLLARGTERDRFWVQVHDRERIDDARYTLAFAPTCMVGANACCHATSAPLRQLRAAFWNTL